MYSGAARVWFRAPDGEISGPARVSLTPEGRVSITIEIEQFSIAPEYRGFLMPFLSGAVPEPLDNGRTTFRPHGTHSIARIQVQTENGMFRGTRALIGNSHFEFSENQNSSITVVANDLEFIVLGQDAPEMWCAPLFGNLRGFGGAETACSVLNRLPYVSFNADGDSCGLEILPATAASPYGAYTAAVFGVIGERPHGTVAEVQRLLPSGLIAILSFAAGSDIRAPWVELRSFDGRLQRRLHLRMGMNQQEDGFPAFTKFDTAHPSSGLGAFLNCFFLLSQTQRLSLIAPMNLIRSGAPGGATVDESIADIVKALDAICKIHGLTHQNLITKLDSQNVGMVGHVLEHARESLKRLRTESKIDQKLDQLAVLDKIISRQANVALKERDFGLAVADLLRKFGLFDADAMNAHYRSVANDVTWEGLLSSVRGQVIHSAAIPVQETGGLLAWFELARHLHDICKRVILLQIGYAGTYAASNAPYTGEYKLDRVQPTATMKELGYTMPPVPP